MKRFKFKKLRDVNTPTSSYEQAAGWDFYIPNDWKLLPGVHSPVELFIMPAWESILLRPNTSIFIPSGIQLSLHSNTAMRFDNRSGNARRGLLVGATIVDTDYQGEIHLNVWNVSKNDITIKCGDKILQGIFFETPKIELYEIPVTESLFTQSSTRGQSGFGSSDQKH